MNLSPETDAHSLNKSLCKNDRTSINELSSIVNKSQSHTNFTFGDGENNRQLLQLNKPQEVVKPLKDPLDFKVKIRQTIIAKEEQSSVDDQGSFKKQKMKCENVASTKY